MEPAAYIKPRNLPGPRSPGSSSDRGAAPGRTSPGCRGQASHLGGVLIVYLLLSILVSCGCVFVSVVACPSVCMCFGHLLLDCVLLSGCSSISFVCALTWSPGLVPVVLRLLALSCSFPVRFCGFFVAWLLVSVVASCLVVTWLLLLCCFFLALLPLYCCFAASLLSLLWNSCLFFVVSSFRTGV